MAMASSISGLKWVKGEIGASLRKVRTSLEEFVDTGTGPSLGRFVPGLISNSSDQWWSGVGARLSTKNLRRGRTYGWHPGTPARHIWEKVQARVEDDLDYIQEELSDDFAFWYDGRHLKFSGDYTR